MNEMNVLAALPQFVDATLGSNNMGKGPTGLLNVLTGCFVCPDTIEEGTWKPKSVETGGLRLTFQRGGGYAGINDHEAIISGDALAKFMAAMKLQATALSRS